ncbi:MAG: response regulator [Proteobacteria bacterium]|nr:response regulator [Pseudomonadota bacterium]
MRSSIQVIMLTGHGSENDKKEALSLGAFGYLQKPIQIDELERHIINAHKFATEDG